MTHELKVWPVFVPALADGSKSFEVRRDDRNFMPGDILNLLGWDPNTGRFTGDHLQRRVRYILFSGKSPGIEPGFVVMGLERTALMDLVAR